MSTAPQPPHKRTQASTVREIRRGFPGDLGRQDAQGYFYLTGRKKELIIRGGHNIDPASIEEPLHRHPAVQIAAAVGRPDAHAGELPVAYVQLKPGACATEDELLSFAREQITERAATPKAIRLVAAMPLTGVGKIFKPELRQREIADALRTALHDAGAQTTRLEVVNNPRVGDSGRGHRGGQHGRRRRPRGAGPVPVPL